MTSFLKQIDPEVKMRDFLFLMASYLHSVRKDSEWEDIEKIVKEEIPKGEEYMGTIAEMFERRGIEKGREEGILIGEQRDMNPDLRPNKKRHAPIPS